MGFFVKLNQNAYSNSKSYIYKSGSYSFLDKFFNVYWSVCVKFVPKSVSANLLTLTGFVCSTISFFLMYLYEPLEGTKYSDRIYLYIGLFLFLYQTLDAIDGKQARRTNTSSPLGQLFDHGCDSITSSLFAFIVSKAVDIPKGFIFYSLLATIQTQTYLFSWIENHTHVYNTSMCSVGLTEGQVLVIFLCLFRGVKGVKKFNIKLKDVLSDKIRFFLCNTILNLETKYILLLSSSFFILLTLLKSIYMGVKNAKKKKEASLQLIIFLIFISVQYYFFQSIVCFKYEMICFLIISLYSSVYILYMNLSNVLKVKMHYFPFPIIIYYISIFILFLKQSNNNNIEKYLIIKDKYLIFCMLIFIVVYLFDYANTIITNCCKELNINFLFNNKKKVKSK